jgi:hypothetical protein
MTIYDEARAAACVARALAQAEQLPSPDTLREACSHD